MINKTNWCRSNQRSDNNRSEEIISN